MSYCQQEPEAPNTFDVEGSLSVFMVGKYIATKQVLFRAHRYSSFFRFIVSHIIILPNYIPKIYVNISLILIWYCINKTYQSISADFFFSSFVFVTKLLINTVTKKYNMERNLKNIILICI